GLRQIGLGLVKWALGKWVIKIEWRARIRGLGEQVTWVAMIVLLGEQVGSKG
ncbi:hypothetical protein A2U01_0105309, partial [Trifolium medium]|nr:hypothetical protein [Trifolium medium]